VSFSSGLFRCPICRRAVCESCAVRRAGCAFCGDECAHAFFFGDDDEEAETSEADAEG